MCDTCGCGQPSSKNEEKKVQYKCKACGHTADEAGDHCDAPMVKTCDCGSGTFSEECCPSETEGEKEDTETEDTAEEEEQD
jgi:hypothetical protein